MRRPSSWLPVATLLLAACADRSPVATTPPVPEPAVQRLECVASVAARTVACTGGGAPTPARGILIGSQGQNVRLASSDVFYDAGTGAFSFDLTVQNLLPYPIGTKDGTTADSGGVKVFLNSGPVTTGGSGTVTPQNQDGVGVFTSTNQAFWKYPQRLAPNEVSAPEEWVFHLDAGVTTFSFTLLVQAETPVLRVLQPAWGDSVGGDSLRVRVLAAAPPQVNFIRAVVGNSTSFLTYTDSGWQGKVSIAGMAPGPKSLVLTAVMPVDSVKLTVPFHNGTALQFSLNLPFNGTVARPGMLVSGSCVHKIPCTASIRIGSTSLWSGPGESFSQTVSLAPWEGTQQTLSVVGTAADGSRIVVDRKVWIESSPRWQEVASGGTHMLAVDSSAVLYRDSSATTDALYFRRLPSGAPELLLTRDRASQGNLRPTLAAITPDGAIFTLPSTSPHAQYDSLYEYRQGVLKTLGVGVRERMRVRGRWFGWQAVGKLFVHDVVADTTHAPPVPPNPAIWDIGPNGDLVYGSNGQVYRYRAGSTLQIGTIGGVYAKTDGNLIVFREYLSYNNERITLFDGSSTTVLSGQPLRWDVNNGWTTFSAYDTNAIVQGWVRTPAGTFTQATSGATRSLSIVIGPNGELVYAQNSRRFLTTFPYGAKVDVGLDWPLLAPMAFSGSTVYTFLGRSAYKLVP
jgi:hypothetical protein